MKITIDTVKKEVTIKEPVKIQELISELEKFNAEKDWGEYTLIVEPPQPTYVPIYPTYQIYPTYPIYPTVIY